MKVKNNKRYKVFIRRILANALPTRDNISELYPNNDQSCPMRLHEKETI